jgi:dynein heavy chain
MSELIKSNAEAKDNSKFLNTLERQFKILQNDDLSTIEQCIPSLFNGLRLVFIISRYYKVEDRMGKLLSAIAIEICDRVKGKINIKALLRPDPDIPYEIQLENTSKLIMQGIDVLAKWLDEHKSTKQNLEKEGGERWDFSSTDIRHLPTRIGKILNEFHKMVDNIQRLLSLLGPRLKAVTGNTDKIDNLIGSVKGLVKSIDDYPHDFYDKTFDESFTKLTNKFRHDSEKIQKEATDLIEATFSFLRSSESGFEFLQKFKTDNKENSLTEISSQLQKRYSDVLVYYRQELRHNIEIFEKGKEKEKENLTRHKPPVAGCIAWKRSIFQRIKTPMVRFHTKESVWNKVQFEEVKKEYVDFAKRLDEYQLSKFKAWEKVVNDKAPEYLKNPVLTKEIGRDGEAIYTVNFHSDFRVIMSEAKYLDRMMSNVSKNVINIALQEEEYYRHVDRLNKMLREYYNTINSLKDVEKNLLSEQLRELESKLDEGADSHYLSSLGLNDFTASCINEIKRFNDKKNKVEEKTRNIEDIIKTMEEAKVIREFDFSNYSKKLSDDFFTLQEFLNYFDKYLHTEIDSLSDKYMRIGETMLPQIAMAIYEKNDQKLPKMRMYYYYWERRVYNALVKMIIRALLSFKALIHRPRKHAEMVPLFKVSTEYSNGKLNINPNPIEINVAIQKLVNTIIDSAIKFPRWKDGTCKFVEKKQGDKGHEEVSANYTFAVEIRQNSVIYTIKADFGDIISQASSRMTKFKGRWELTNKEYTNDDNIVERYKGGLFDNRHKEFVEKQLDKNPDISAIEMNLDIFHTLLIEFEESPDEIDADFIKMDFTKVKRAFINQTKERFKKIGAILIKVCEKDSEELKQEILNYYNEIKKEEDTRDQLKKCLNTLAKIKDSTLDMEFAIGELVEKYRILKKYQHFGLEMDETKYNVSMNMQVMWNKLLLRAKQKHDSIKTSILGFEAQTKADVRSLLEKINDLHALYIKSGPAAIETSLNEGLEKMVFFKSEVVTLNLLRAEAVRMQKLFSMEVTSFANLVFIDEELKKIDIIYSFYAKMKSMMEEWARKAWDKIEYKDLEEGRKTFSSKIKEFQKSNQLSVTEVFKKLKTKVDEFTKSLPLIDRLKNNPFFKEQHWERLLRAIDKPIEGINFSSITLQQVFDMNLQDYPDQVDAVVSAAQSEYQNKKELTAIEDFWRTASFECSDHKKGGYKVKVSEDIKASLDDHLNTLQSIEGSKFAGLALKQEVKRYIDSLTKVQETIDAWIQVQTKWLYLEGIYIGNEDIRQQLPKDTKTFEQHHKTFKGLNDKVSKNLSIMVNCVHNDTTLPQLKNLMTSLDKSQKSLSDYLKSKKKVFPRFYFISDEDLLSILGSSDPNSIQPHLIKLFDNVKSLTFEKGKITHMVSDEGENFPYFEAYKPEGAVEQWMTKVDNLMIDTLRKLTKEGVFMFAKMEKSDWLSKFIGMIVLTAKQIWWTWKVEDVFRKVKEGDKYAMKKEANVQTEDLNSTITMIRSDLEGIDPSGKLRKKLNNLIIVDVHGRDIVDRFVRDSILDARVFEWESQLRFYWRNSLNDIVIEQCTGNLRYGFEYQGLTSRLVITPLTDRCVMTLTTALTFYLGGAPAGPAGTGKTETCKDLGKNLAIRAVVTNCGETFDSFAMGNTFSGLCQSGFWGVFDEFNRITPPVLSVVSSQIDNIQRALREGKTNCEMLGDDIGVKKTVGIFVTMNPGYEGRSDLPDNLKGMFRPVTMITPDLNIICENMLMSEGFQEARMLSKKMTRLYKLSSEQLSKQKHYDFQLRALKSVLVMAGGLKRAQPDFAEELVLMKALKEMNMPKFVAEDVRLFQGLLNDLFPGLVIEAASHKDMNQKLLEIQARRGLQELQEQAAKAIQLYETMETRHTTMVIGPTGSGKTTVIDLLKEERVIPNVRNCVSYTLNPKAQPIRELYGRLDPQNREWTEGILSKIFKQANSDLPERGPNDKGPKEELRWIVLDGDVDAVWVEDMNSVMDDNKLLTLSNGDRIRLRNYCKLLFEVSNLVWASPATVSRCGMVYIDPDLLGFEPYFLSWKNKYTKDKDPEVDEMFMEFYQKYIKYLVELIFDGKTTEEGVGKPLELNLPRTKLNLVTQFCNLMDSIIPDPNTVLESNSLENLFCYCCIWSFGSCVKDRTQFWAHFSTVPSIPVPFNFYDGIYDFVEKQWIEVKKRVPHYEPITKFEDYAKILVPTADTVKYTHLLGILMDKGKQCLLVGETGTAKTVIIKSYLSRLNYDSYVFLTMNFSSRTNSMEVQKNIETGGVTERLRPGLWGPKSGKKLIIFIDELHMPLPDKYDTQQPIALLRFLLDKKIMYERGGFLEKREFRDTQFVTALLPPGGGYTMVDPRFLSLFNCINVLFPSEENIKTIYNSILSAHLKAKSFPEDVKELCKDVTVSTYKLFERVCLALPRSPIKFHYIFNLRELSKVYQGLLRSTKEMFDTKEKFVRLWKNECCRVFIDRLIAEKDKDLVLSDIHEIIQGSFGDEILKKVKEGDFFYGDFKEASPSDKEVEDPKIYQSLETFDKVRAKFEKLLEEYNEEMSEMNMVMFYDAVDHLVRLLRVLKFPNAHAMLVGVGGSGKQSITKLATFIASFKLFTIQLKKIYTDAHFRADIFELYKNRLLGQETVFLFTDSQILEEGFLESVNTLLTVGIINSQFDSSMKSGMILECDEKAKKAGKSGSSDEMWEFVVDILKKNLHIVLCMSPAGDNLRLRCRSFPGIVSSTTIDWFFPWPAEALRNVAEVELKELQMEESVAQKIVEHFVYVHLRIPIFR